MYMAVVVLVGVGVFVGFLLGVRTEAASWHAHAMTEKCQETPYHSRGGFYYVVPEHVFCTYFRLREEKP
jgi:hypothetical protein